MARSTCSRTTANCCGTVLERQSGVAASSFLQLNSQRLPRCGCTSGPHRTSPVIPHGIARALMQGSHKSGSASYVFEQSGLFGHLLPEFKKATSIDVKVVALGTGQAI